MNENLSEVFYILLHIREGYGVQMRTPTTGRDTRAIPSGEGIFIQSMTSVPNQNGEGFG